MKKLLFLISLLIAITSETIQLSAQVNNKLGCYADFYYYDYSPVQIAMGLPYRIIQLVDSSYTNVVKRAWLIDGDTASIINPTYKYFPTSSTTKDTINVCLTISTKNNCIKTICKRIPLQRTLTNCKADFNYYDNIKIYCLLPCAPIEFIDNSTGDVTSWYWEFDKDTSSQQNPLKIFNPSQIPSQACLTIKTSDGCKDRICKPIITKDTIATPICKVSFKYAINDCTIVIPEYVPYTFTPYTDKKVLDWSWSFGDGSSSKETMPTHSFYFLGGTFRVCVKILTSDSCIAEYCDYITVGHDSVPSNLCQAGFNIVKMPWISSTPYAYSFKNTSSSNAVSWYWDFGDGKTSTEQSPQHFYAINDSGKQYKISLTIKTTDSCKSSYSQQLILNMDSIPDCSADFTFNPNTLIMAPGSAYNFYDLSSGNPVEWLWNFGDGNTSTLQNPLHIFTYLKVDSNGYYSYPKVCLTIKTKNGCVKTSCKYIIPDSVPKTQCKASYSYSKPFNDSTGFNFRDASTTNAVSWHWDFGDGTTSAEQNPQHIFNLSNIPMIMIYPPPPIRVSVCLTIRTKDSCTDIYCESIDPIAISKPVCNNRIRISTSTVLGAQCEGTASATLIDGSGNQVKANSYYWSTGATSSSIDQICSNKSYYVSIIDINGCETGGSFSILDNSQQNSNIGLWQYNKVDSFYHFSYTPVSDSVITYWYLGDWAIIGNDVYIQDNVKDLNLVVKDTKGNIFQQETIIMPSETPIPSNPLSEVNISLYPIPATDNLNVSMNGVIGIAKYEILNELGIIQKRGVFYDLDGKHILTINISDLNTGIFIMKLWLNENTVKVLKFNK